MTVLLTPTEQRIIDLLSDGYPHHRLDLMKLLDDDMTSWKTLAVHVYNIRRKIRPTGRDVITELVNPRAHPHYRLVRLLGSACNGYR